MNYIFGVVLVAIVVAIGFFAYGPQRVWERVTGPSDLGELDLAKVTRNASPNDALACSDTLCADQKVDLVLPAYDSAPNDLITRLENSARVLDRSVTRVDDESEPTKARFVTLSPTMKFPDTIWAEAVELGGGKSGLRVYARAKLGYSDLGANLKRIQAWTAEL
ncbi:MAG: DUF1499 domain-containing protein [Pseudomonadota bacterium]